jgi:hypothetical protein
VVHTSVAANHCARVVRITGQGVNAAMAVVLGGTPVLFGLVERTTASEAVSWARVGPHVHRIGLLEAIVLPIIIGYHSLCLTRLESFLPGIRTRVHMRHLFLIVLFTDLFVLFFFDHVLLRLSISSTSDSALLLSIMAIIELKGHDDLPIAIRLLRVNFADPLVEGLVHSFISRVLPIGGLSGEELFLCDVVGF